MVSTALMRLCMEARKRCGAIGKQMAQDDKWIEPIEVKAETALRNGYNVKDYSDFREAHRDAWEETLQFELLWKRQVREIAEEDFNRNGLDITKEDHYILFLQEFDESGIEALWEEWEAAVNLRAFWEKHYNK